MWSLEWVNIRTNVRTYVLTYIRTGQTLYPLHNFVVRGDNNGTPHLKITKEPKQESRLGTASNKITVGRGGGGVASSSASSSLRSISLRPWFCLGSSDTSYQSGYPPHSLSVLALKGQFQQIFAYCKHAQVNKYNFYAVQIIRKCYRVN